MDSNRSSANKYIYETKNNHSEEKKQSTELLFRFGYTAKKITITKNYETVYYLGFSRV